MSEDKSEVDSRSKRSVEAIRVYCQEPVCLKGQSETVCDCEVASDKRIDGEEWLFMQNDACFRRPVVLISLDYLMEEGYLLGDWRLTC